MLAVGLFFLSAVAAAADNVATVTILEGDATLIRGASRYVLLEGVRLNDEDIVHLAPASFAQIEFADGLRVGTGPGTKLLVGPKWAKEKNPRSGRLYLHSGWIKLTPGKTPATPPVSVSGVLADLTQTGTTVTSSGAEDLQVFVESQDAKLSDRAAAAPISLKGGDFYSRKGGDKGQIAGRPPAEFLEILPRPFRDNIPARIERFKENPPAMKPGVPIVYEDVALWLKTETSVRRQFTTRWRAPADDKTFRAGLVADMKFHPEWDRILFPEKYLPKKPVTPAPAAAPVSKPAAAPSPSSSQ